MTKKGSILASSDTVESEGGAVDETVLNIVQKIFKKCQ
jgi:hypothetical protein